MQINRGTVPTSVEREIDINIARDEVIAILSQFVKRKMQIDNLRFDDLSIVASKDDAGEMRMNGITLLGFEIFVLQYPEDNGPVKAQAFSSTPIAIPPSPPTTTPPTTTPPKASNLNPPLQALATAAATQAAQHLADKK